MAKPKRRKRKNPHAVALGKLGGRLGGLARTEAKIAAARINGRLGGRPRKRNKGKGGTDK